MEDRFRALLSRLDAACREGQYRTVLELLDQAYVRASASERDAFLALLRAEERLDCQVAQQMQRVADQAEKAGEFEASLRARWGKNEQGHPRAGHEHAFFLPADEDGDGRIDHLTVFAPMGFNPLECLAIHGGTWCLSAQSPRMAVRYGIIPSSARAAHWRWARTMPTCTPAKRPSATRSVPSR
jgi:hypothetical protein